MSKFTPHKLVPDNTPGAKDKGGHREAVYKELPESGKRQVDFVIEHRDDIAKKLDYAEKDIDQTLRQENKKAQSPHDTWRSNDILDKPGDERAPLQLPLFSDWTPED